MKKAIFSTLLFLLTSLLPTWAQTPTLPPDQAPITVRRPDEARWQKLRTDRAYHYGQDMTLAENPLERLLARILNWLYQWFYSADHKTSRNWLTIAFVVGMAIFVVIKILGMNKAALLGRRAKSGDLPYVIGDENIHTLAFDEEITAALSRNQFRLAVRLYYLKTLKALSDRNFIDWQPNKTNRAYVTELSVAPLRPDFDQITGQFERIWYGNFPIEASEFERLQQGFRSFDHALSTY